MKTGIFVTGTDTGVGKTTYCAKLLRETSRHPNASLSGYFKPIQTGPDKDLDTLRSRTEGICAPSLRFAEPVYDLPEASAPLRAARTAGIHIELDEIERRWAALPNGHWIVEGAGGLFVPLAVGITISDLVARLRLPLVIVTSTRLGTINHTLLTCHAARQAGHEIHGLVLNGPPDPGLRSVLEDFSGAPVIEELPWWA